jgi:hypothetical protein
MAKFNRYKDPSSIRLSDSVPISEGIDKLLNTYNLENKYLQTLITTKWEHFMGPSVATRTEKIYFKGKTMHVVLTSAPLKHQLNLSKSKIIALINDEMNQSLIDDVVFL